MNPLRGVALVLVVGGIAALAFGGFNYTKDTHEAHVGSMELVVKNRQHVNVPVWAGIGAIIIGAGFLLVPANKS
jgi:hypothetical protein